MIRPPKVFAHLGKPPYPASLGGRLVQLLVKLSLHLVEKLQKLRRGLSQDRRV
jgi:hypothetical protein